MDLSAAGLIRKLPDLAEIGNYQCSHEHCPSDQKEWDDSKQRFVKLSRRKLVEGVALC